MPAPTMIDALDAAYVAGFFDGEGHISIRSRAKQSKRSQHHQILAGITNTNKDLLDWIQSVFGGSIHPKRRYSKNHSQAWELLIFNNDLRSFL